MRLHNLKLFFIFAFFLQGCIGQDAKLKKLCKEIKITVETNKSDDKNSEIRKLVRQIKSIKTDEACDSLKSIFLLLESWEVSYEPLYILSEFNTKKSLKVLAGIIRNYPLDNPANMSFIWDLVGKTENISIMFPDLSYSLGKQKWTNGDVLMMINSAYQNGHINQEQLESSKGNLISFYDNLKIERDSLKGSKYYEEYYYSHLTDLLKCLRIYNSNEKINTIYKEVLKDNSNFEKFCSLESAEYNNESKRKITAVFEASLGLIQNNQNIEEKYLELIVAEPLYHNTFYKELKTLKKENAFPTNYLTKQYFAISDLSYSKENTADDALPNCFELLEKREIKDGENKGVYFFYNSIWDKDKTLINLSISGPQPLEEKEFIIKGTKTNKIYTEDFSRTEIKKEIDKIILKLSE
jgi:hypothetical protein